MFLLHTKCLILEGSLNNSNHFSLWEMRGLGSGHVICGPMRGLEINFTGRGRTNVQRYIATLWLNRPRGRFSEKMVFKGVNSLHPFFKVMGETKSALSYSHVRVPYRTNQRQQKIKRRCQEHQKQPKYPKTRKRVIFRGDDNLGAFLSRFWERLKGIWTPHMWWYLMKSIRENYYFKGAVRNIKNSQNGDLGPFT